MRWEGRLARFDVHGEPKSFRGRLIGRAIKNVMSVREYNIEQFMNTIAVLGGAFSPNEETILFSTNRNGVFNAYELPVTGGKPKQLTHSVNDGVYGLAYFPDGRILVSQDTGGNENFHLYAVEISGGRQDLTPGADVTIRFMGHSKDRKSFYFATNERDSHFFDIYRMDASDLKREMLFQDSIGYEFGCISDDERYLAFTKPDTRENTDIYLYDSVRGELRHLTPHLGDICFRALCFDVNTHHLYYRTDEGSDFFYVARYELQTGKTETVVKTDCNAYLMFSPGGRYRMEATDDDGRITMRLYDQQSDQAVSIPSFPDGHITGIRFSDSERLMALYVKGDRAPDNLYVYDFGNARVRKLTDSLNPEIDPRDLVDSERVRYESFDGLEIPALLWKPHQANTNNRAPALVWVHGGPGGQTRKGYSGRIQFLINHGYVVLGVNNRGSSGYGKAFMAADKRRHGREPLWDCIEAKRYLASLDYVDPLRIGIIGASYGGYMVLAALAFQPEEFTVGVDLFGTSNWLRTIESFPPYWKKSLNHYYEKIGDPRIDQEMLKEISPLFHAYKIIKPLLVLQGANDPRVLRVESDEIVEAVRKNGGVAEYCVFEDEGHGFNKRVNKIQAYECVLRFLNKYLKGEVENSSF